MICKVNNNRESIMKNENKDQAKSCSIKEEICSRGKSSCGCGSSGAIYGFGVVGALFYFLQNAHTIGAVLLGIGKAIVWPAILMYQLLAYLHL
jgi:mevalonate kinase